MNSAQLLKTCKFQVFKLQSSKWEIHLYACYQFSVTVIPPPTQQVSAEDEMKNCDRLFSSLTRSVEESREEVMLELRDRQKGAERRSERLIGELQRESTELQGRNTDLEELLNSEDHLHLLQVSPNLKLHQGLWCGGWDLQLNTVF